LQTTAGNRRTTERRETRRKRERCGKTGSTTCAKTQFGGSSPRQVTGHGFTTCEKNQFAGGSVTGPDSGYPLGRGPQVPQYHSGLQPLPRPLPAFCSDQGLSRSSSSQQRAGTQACGQNEELHANLRRAPAGRRRTTPRNPFRALCHESPQHGLLTHGSLPAISRADGGDRSSPTSQSASSA